MSARPVVAVTRDEGSGGALARALTLRGAEPLLVPVVATLPPADERPLDAALAALAGFDWLVLTSGRAASLLAARGLAEALEPATRPRVAAVGPATAAVLRSLGIEPDLAAAEAGARGLLAALPRAGLRGSRVLWPRSDAALPELRDGLRAQGATVVDPIAYRTLPKAGPGLQELSARLAERSLAAATFLSPSAAEALAGALPCAAGLGCLGESALVASIGPTTSAALRALGAPPDVEARERSVRGLAAAVMDALDQRRCRP